MKALLTKKNILITLVLLLVLKIVTTYFTNINGRDIDNDRTEKYLQQVNALQYNEEQGKQPNIILILTDDMGFADLSSYGSTVIDTPNIDKLANQGMKMTNFYAPSSLCTPARAAILTGRYAPRTHLPAVVFDSGTAINTIRKYAGFYSYGMDGLSPDEATVSKVLQARGYSTGVVGKWHLGSAPEYAPEKAGFDFAYIPDKSVELTTLTKNYTEKSLEFISENKDKPFFLYYATTIPHEPLHRVEAFKDQSKAGMYGEMIMETDWSVGVIMDKLVELGIDDNTLVIFTSDNGPFRQGSAGDFRGGKGLTTMGGQRVPFIAYWPEVIPKGQVSDEMAMGIDFFPTVLDIAGIPMPTDRTIDGKNIMPLLTGESKETPHDYLFMINDQVVESVLDKDGYKYQIPTAPDISKFWYLTKGPYLFNTLDDPSESYSILEMNPEKSTELAGNIKAFQAELDNDLRGWR
ncbi:sulfatase-like hydrolase/transferase [Thalassotalea hakodatensis]|uniref:sulfatase-like hydrolase/transferase n=1 Tax=Thalassotalea hakodatensis TaxID=3030492 RepID=UPI0025731A96|nr:sulfatase-like hydrolase/transferase [Thalassotalea hakodatensis]